MSLSMKDDEYLLGLDSVGAKEDRQRDLICHDVILCRFSVFNLNKLKFLSL